MRQKLALVTILLLGFGWPAYAQAGRISWSPQSLEDALAQAARDQKPTLAYFYADW
ncbi:MAG: hypothetical protein HYY16_15020 [Planctomycetes bacterium]|nr:hypothetical protein [Planctomycetota bacterium]